MCLSVLFVLLTSIYLLLLLFLLLGVNHLSTAFPGNGKRGQRWGVLIKLIFRWKNLTPPSQTLRHWAAQHCLDCFFFLCPFINMLLGVFLTVSNQIRTSVYVSSALCSTLLWVVFVCLLCSDLDLFWLEMLYSAHMKAFWEVQQILNRNQQNLCGWALWVFVYWGV